MDWPTQAPGTTADVALLLEGTYPHVSGGVSGWVHQLVQAMPERTFSLVFLGSTPDAYGPPRYEAPANVVHLERHWLGAAPSGRSPKARPIPPEPLAANVRLHEALASGQTPAKSDSTAVLRALGAPDGLSESAFRHGEEAWAQLTRAFDSRPDGSFLDAFWTMRTMHGPLFTVARAAEGIPEARLFHAVSTGYAGFLGALLAHRRRRPLLLSEHGIYTKERRIDLANAAWIRDDAPGADCLRETWVRFFEGLGRLAYDASGRIVSLFEGNRRRQVADGARTERTVVVPNGIDVPRFSALRTLRPSPPPRVVGLVGRVVPIKDVRTFVRAMRTVCDRLEGAEGWVVGPEDEAPAYALECRALARSLGLESRVTFLGLRRPDDILPRLGVLALTSISEALPLVVLEAFASGLPVVTTDVGACRELVEGRDEADRALGPAGIVTRMASPGETAEALATLLSDGERWRRARNAGIARVERSYTEAGMVAAYRALYDEAGTWPA
jgi:glycosyltransferase involved in cell wall biosynthesis